VSIAAKLVLLIAVFVGGMMAGIKWHAGQDAIKENARQVNQRATERLQRQNSNTAAVAHESDKVQIQKVFVPITQEVERVVTLYRDRACFDDDGLRAINAAVNRANGDSGEPGNAVSKPAASP